VKRRAVFLDRDGTLNVDVGFTHRLDDLKLIDGVVPGLKQLAKLGFQLIVTTNQSGVARGYFSPAQMHAFNAALVAQLRELDVRIEGVYCCPFHPTEGIGAYRCDSPLRKPQPGMILKAAAEHDIDLKASFAIGDRTSDVLAGQSAGCRAILLRTDDDTADKTTAIDPSVHPDFTAADLVEAAAHVGRSMRGSSGTAVMRSRARRTASIRTKKPLRNRA
jgi:D-glycero-D-manno-heptose 1,7-bisphosphate phosphatase